VEGDARPRYDLRRCLAVAEERWQVLACANCVGDRFGARHAIRARSHSARKAWGGPALFARQRHEARRCLIGQTSRMPQLRFGSPPLLADARCAPWLRPARKDVPPPLRGSFGSARMRSDSLRRAAVSCLFLRTRCSCSMGSDSNFAGGSVVGRCFRGEIRV
jgi:hypothetical protein